MTPRRNKRVLAAALAVALAVAANAGWRWWHNHPPYGPEALAAKSSLTLVSYQAARAALGEGVNAPYPQPGDQLVLGRVTWRVPPEPLDGGWFTILVIDKRTDRKPAVFSVAAARQDTVGVGSDGVLNKVAERYPWLRGAGDIQTGDDTWRSNGSVVVASGEDTSPLTFVALFPAIEEPLPPETAIAAAPVAISDLLVALVHIGPDRQVYWAQRLQG